MDNSQLGKRLDFVSSRRIKQILLSRNISIIHTKNPPVSKYNEKTASQKYNEKTVSQKYYYIDRFFVGDFQNLCLSIYVSSNLKNHEKEYFKTAYLSSLKEKSTCETRKIKFQLKKIAKISFQIDEFSLMKEMNIKIKNMYKEILE